MNQTVELEVALEELLKGRSGKYVEKIANFVVRWGIDPTDPLFLVMAGLGETVTIIEEAPIEIQAAAKTIFTDIGVTVDRAAELSVHRQREQINKLVDEILKQTEARRSHSFFKSLIPAASLVFGILSLGFLAGMTVPRFFEKPLDPTGPVQLTLEQAIALQWATSSQGKQAKKIWDLNQGWLDNRRCEQQVRKLGVTMSYGSQKYTKGFCLIWIEPPSGGESVIGE